MLMPVMARIKGTGCSCYSPQTSPSCPQASVSSNITQVFRCQLIVNRRSLSFTDNDSLALAIEHDIDLANMDANMDANLQNLERIINTSDWLRNNELEPSIGERNCPAEADPYGTRGLSVYTAFIKNQDADTYGCKYEPCRAYSTRNMEEAIRHQRHHHFDHSPFVCVPTSGNTWYVLVFSPTRASVGD